MACERDMMPIIVKKAASVQRWSPYVDHEDLVQEGRITLLRCLISYDENREGGNLKKYVARSLDNCYHDLFWNAVAQCRMPRSFVRGLDGEWTQVKSPVLSLDQMFIDIPGAAQTPHDAMETSLLDSEARRFRMKLLNMLTGKDKSVFEAKFNPSTSMLKMCDNLGYDLDEECPEVPNVIVAKHLGITKNAVDHSMYKIRRAFTKLVKDVDFSDLFGEAVEKQGWPMIHINDACGHNQEFVRRIIKERNLDPEPLPGWDSRSDHVQITGNCARWVEHYSWGVVVVLKMGDEWRTLVIECERINLSTGGVFSTSGIQEELRDYVPWYRQLVTKLKEAKKHAK